MTEVDHLGTLRLQDAAHDRDRGVVAIEEARRGHEAQWPVAHGIRTFPAARAVRRG
jgi:hypothetical protein